MVDNTLKVLTLVPTLEQQFAEQVQRSGAIHGALDPERAQKFFDNLNAEIENVGSRAYSCAYLFTSHTFSFQEFS